MYTLIELRRDDLKDINEKTIDSMLNTILNLLIYRLQAIQYIYKLSTLHYNTLYIIDIFNESDWPNKRYMLEYT